MENVELQEQSTDIVKKEVNEIEKSLMESPVVISLANKAKEYNTGEILKYGDKPAKEISTFADSLLHSVSSNSVESSNTLLKKITTIMSKFDRKDFDANNKGFLKKLSGNLQKE